MMRTPRFKRKLFPYALENENAVFFNFNFLLVLHGYASGHVLTSELKQELIIVREK